MEGEAMAFRSIDTIRRGTRLFWGICAACAVCLPVAASGQNILNPGTAGIAAESGPINGALDSGETVTVTLPIVNNGGPGANHREPGCDPASGGRRFFPSGPQNYGAVAGATVVRPFTFTATAACGVFVYITLQLQDGGTSIVYRLRTCSSANHHDLFERQHRRADSRREYGRDSARCP